jgi:segregation and condensation protein A
MPKKHLGIQHLSLDDLASLFQQLLSKAEPKRSTVTEEVWKVSDKITDLLSLLKNNKPIVFTSLFTPEKSREEWIVTFLALLELMKMGEACVGTHEATSEIVVFRNQSG